MLDEVHACPSLNDAVEEREHGCFLFEVVVKYVVFLSGHGDGVCARAVDGVEFMPDYIARRVRYVDVDVDRLVVLSALDGERSRSCAYFE